MSVAAKQAAHVFAIMANTRDGTGRCGIARGWGRR